MAGDWIKMRWNLARDPSVIGISTDTGLDEFAVVGRLHHFWSWADQQTQNGYAAIKQKWINAYLRCDGFAEAMEKHGWLIIENDSIRIPRFDRHCSKPAKNRALTKRRMVANRLRSNQTKASPEKRREESLSYDGPTAGEKHFNRFWEEYPNPVHRPAAIRQWRAMFIQPAQVDEVLAGLAKWVACDEWTREKGRFIPRPAKFLEGRLWETPPKTAPPSKPSITDAQIIANRETAKRQREAAANAPTLKELAEKEQNAN